MMSTPRFLYMSMLALFLLLNACLSSYQEPQSTIRSEEWGQVNGKEVKLFTLTNKQGMVMKLTNFGGIITSIIVPDKDGSMSDVVLGFDNLQQYVDGHPCFGATIGRFANRIRNGQFEIEGKTYQLTQNNNDHCIHGGNEFDTAVWEGEEVKTDLGLGVKLHYFSKDGSHGFPGNLESYVTYTLTEENAIHVTFEATTDKATHVSMTQHSYFNLNGATAPIFDHIIHMESDQYTEIDEDIVPTGIIGSTKGKAWDVSEPTRMGDNIHDLDHKGYHFCYVFANPEKQLKEVIWVEDSQSGRTMTVSTTQPGVQFYTGNGINEDFVGKYDISYGPHMAFCLETQHLPDTPNHPNFPSSLLKPGEKYEETVMYAFGTKD